MLRHTHRGSTNIFPGAPSFEKLSYLSPQTVVEKKTDALTSAYRMQVFE